MKNVCVFCGSSEDLDSDYYELAFELGELLGKNSLNLIHGGGIIGLMGRLLQAAKENGSKVTGVVPERLNQPHIANDLHQHLVVTNDMKDRKEYMRENSDAFIALPGGFGTMEEMLEVITLKQLKYHKKPIVIINFKHFYDPLITQFETLYLKSFANIAYKDLYYVASSSNEAIDYIKNYKFSNIYDKYLRE